jgi:hypothetical protein
MQILFCCTVDFKLNQACLDDNMHVSVVGSLEIQTDLIVVEVVVVESV